MNKIIGAVKNWLKTNPVRTLAYPVVGVVVTYLVAQGVIDHNTSDLIMSVLALLGGAGATEGARALVWSPASVADLVKRLTPPTPPAQS